MNPKTRRGHAWYVTTMAFLGQVIVGLAVFFALHDQILIASIWGLTVPIWLVNVWFSTSTAYRSGWIEHADGDLT